MTTATRLTGDAMLDRIQVVIENANVLRIEATATAKAEACGYIKEDGKVDYVEFYTALLEAKGLLNQTDDEEVSELRAELNERYGEDAVDVFCEIWSEDDLEGFEDAYCGEYESGAAYAEELVNTCCGLSRDLPSFVEIDWRATWDNLSYDYYFENGFIFNANW